MTGYRIGKVHYENFGPFKDVEFDFSFPGLTVVEGYIKGMRGCDSNGAGKSFLFDGVAWALYGRCIREKYKGDDVIRLGSKGGCAVTVELLGGPEPVTVERCRKHTKLGNTVILRVGGEDKSRGTATGTTNAIASTLGMDFTSFCNSVAFGVREDVKSFFAAPDADRKKVLERILGLELYAEAEKVARFRLKDVAGEIEHLTLKRMQLQTALSEKQKMRDELTESGDQEDLDLDLKRLTLGARAKRRKAGDIAQHMKDLGALRAAEKEKYDKVHAAWELKSQEHAEAKSKLEKEERKVERAIAEHKGTWRSLEQRVNSFKKLSGKKCPTCTQTVPPELVQKIDVQIGNEMGEVVSEGSALGDQLMQTTHDKEALEVPKEPEEPAQISMLEEEIDEEATRRKDHLRNALVEDARAKEMKAAQGRLEAQAEGLQAEIDKTMKDLQGTEDEHAENEKRMAALEFWIEGFGNQGLKSFLIEAEIPEINKAATQYAQRLICNGASVRLSATKSLKTKDVKREELTVEGFIPRCTRSYAGASKGQKKRMDLSLILAFRELVASRQVKSFRQLFADELFDGVDKTGTEAVCEVLRDISEECPVTLVTHNAAIKPLAERVVLVYHDGEQATLKGPEKPVKAKLGAVKKRSRKR